ncbi:HVO_0234 family beta-propeller protein [Halosolutus gelatinilyticus]|uniref:HVO_0234 family beta-propeller protein n=1 Tax=Halosolutus gelatinilyticus TaxID=2931975 RepID=UPI001FF48430|nr:hypothetical protein [Halosolutus gelatinilyticus]
MDSIEEKRVYGDRRGAIDAYVASSVGVVRVRIAGDAVGEFGLCDRCDARDAAAAGTDAVAIATSEDVRVLDPTSEPDSGAAAETAFVGTGFGPAVAVGYDGGTLLAADADGRIGRRADGNWEWIDGESTGSETSERGSIGTVRAIDGNLVATDAGAYRVRDGDLDYAGLKDVRDVSAAGVPLAAADDGLYKLGNGWMRVRDGDFDVVAADPRAEPGRLDRAHAVAGGTLYERDPDDGEWRAIDESTETIVGIGYGEAVYAVTERGAFLVETAADDPETWRSRALGIGDVTGFAVPPSG